MDDNQKPLSIPLKNNKAWEKECDSKTSAERSNNREKEDYKF